MMKRALSFFLSLCMCFAIVPTAYAGEGISSEILIQEISEIVCSGLPIVYGELTAEESETLMVGTPIAAYRIAEANLEPIDYTIYPIFAKGAIIAFVTAPQEEEYRHQYTLAVDFAPELQAYYATSDSKEFALLFTLNGIYVIDATNGLTCLKETVE